MLIRFIYNFLIILFLLDVLFTYVYFPSTKGKEADTEAAISSTPSWASALDPKAYKYISALHLLFTPVAYLIILTVAVHSTKHRIRTMFADITHPIFNFTLSNKSLSSESKSKSKPLTLLFIALQIIYLSLSYSRISSSGKDLLMGMANQFAFLGLINFSFFLIPVSNHNPLLATFNVPAEIALGLHMLFGQTGVLLMVVHGLLHVVRFNKEKGEDYYYSGSVWRLLFPPSSCFFCSKDDSCDSGIEGEEASCYYLWRNFTGLLAVAAMVAIYFTSLEKIRRKFYSIFFVSHVTLVPLAFIAAIYHWDRMFMWLLTPFTIYLISKSMVYWDSWRRGRGNNVITRRRIGENPSIHELTVRKTFDDCNNFKGGQWLKVTIPSVSRRLSHPFSVFSIDEDCNTMKIVVKGDGEQGGEWMKALVRGERPVLVEGYYGSLTRVERLTRGGEVGILVAGGIGITPIFSTLEKILRNWGDGDRDRERDREREREREREMGTKMTKLKLIFACKDATFGKYVLRKIRNLVESKPLLGLEFKVECYITGGRGWGDEEEVGGEGEMEGGGGEQHDYDHENEHNSKSFSPTIFSVQTQDTKATVVTFGTFVATFVLSYYMALYVALKVQKEGQMTERIWAPVVVGAIIFLTVGLFLGGFVLLGGGRGAGQGRYRGEEGGGEDVGNLLVEMVNVRHIENVNENESENESGSENRSNNNNRNNENWIEKHSGRPDFRQAFEDLNGRSVTVMNCGPTSMSDDLKMALRGVGNCQFYEEAFQF